MLFGHDDYNPHKNKLVDTSSEVKAAGCEWNIDFLKESPPDNRRDRDEDLELVPIKEGPYLKFGTVTGRCECCLNSDNALLTSC